MGPAAPLSPEALASLASRLALLRQVEVDYPTIVQQLETEGAPPETFLHLPLFLESDRAAALRVMLGFRRDRAIPWETVRSVLLHHRVAPESAVAWETRSPGQAARALGVPYWVQAATRGGSDRDKGQGLFRLHGLTQARRLPRGLVLERLELSGLHSLEALPEEAQVRSSVILDDLPLVTRWPAWLLKHNGRLVVRDCPGLGVPPMSISPHISLRLDCQPCPRGPLAWGPLRELELNRMKDLTHLPRCLQVDSLRLSHCPALITVPRLLDGDSAKSLPRPGALERNVQIRHCPSLAALADETDYPAHLELDDCAALESLGNGLRLGGNLSLMRLPRLRRLPPGLRVPGNLLLKDLPALEDLGEGLVVSGHLVLRELPRLARFPPGLKVRGDLVLLGCASVPEPVPDMDVRGGIHLHPSFRNLRWPASLRRKLVAEPIEPVPGNWPAEPGINWSGHAFPDVHPSPPATPPAASPGP